MIDRIFSAALTFCLLAAGTLAIGSALFGPDVRVAHARTPVVEMPMVTVKGQRTALAVDGSASTLADAHDATACAIARTTTLTAAPVAAAPALAHI
jgi:hypothetical protein